MWVIESRISKNPKFYPVSFLNFCFNSEKFGRLLGFSSQQLVAMSNTYLSALSLGIIGLVKGSTPLKTSKMISVFEIGLNNNIVGNTELTFNCFLISFH